MTVLVAWAALAFCLLAIGTTASRLIGAMRGGAAARVTGVLVWSAVLAVCYSMALSAFHALTWPALLALSAGGAVVARRRRVGLPFLERPMAPEPDPPDTAPADRMLAGAVLAVLGGLGAVSAYTILFTPEIAGDNLSYHLPRLGYWLQSRAVAPSLANNPRIGTFPPNGNVLQLLPVLFLRDERLCGFAQLISWYATALAIYGMARHLRLPRSSAALAALLWSAIPSVVTQSAVSMVDLVAAFFLAASVFFLLLDRSDPSTTTFATSVVAAAFAVGTKSQTLPAAAAVWALLAFGLLGGARRPGHAACAGLAVAVFLLVFPFPIGNYLLYGHPSGPAPLQHLLLDPALRSLAKNAQLVGAPLSFWRWGETAHGDPALAYAGWLDATFAEGLGLLWTGSVALSIPYALWHGFRLRRQGAAAELVLVGLGLIALIAVLYVARHQPSVVRFAIPAAALLSVTFAVSHARIVSGRARRLAVPLAVFILTLASFVCWTHVRRALQWRSAAAAGAPSGPVELGASEARYGVDLAPIAAAVRRLGKGSRVGLLTRQSTYEGLAFGDRYEVTPVPLSYDAPKTVAELERHDLDAVWVNDLLINLFRVDASDMPADRSEAGAERWSVSHYRGYEEEFVRVHERVTFWQDLSPIALALLAPDSGWGLAASANGGFFFVKGSAPLTAPRILNVSNPNGLETFQGQPFFWIGGSPTEIRLYAPRSGAAALSGEFLPGPSVSGAANRRLRIDVAGAAPSDVVVTRGVQEVALELAAGFTVVRVTALDPPDVGQVSGDRRPMIVGVKGLQLRPTRGEG